MGFVRFSDWCQMFFICENREEIRQEQVIGENTNKRLLYFAAKVKNPVYSVRIPVMFRIFSHLVTEDLSLMRPLDWPKVLYGLTILILLSLALLVLLYTR